MNKSGKNKILRESVIFLLFFTAVYFYTSAVHRNQGYFNWKSEIWSDRAGYYSYLPAFFYFHFRANEFPAGMDEKTGSGFILEVQSGKIRTKYTYGVAFMVSPFFLGADCISRLFNIPRDGGFSPLFHKAMNLAALFYLVLGLWLLKRFLERYMKEGIALVTLLVIFTGTNLLFYSTTDTLMSHVYSFFLFSLLLFCLTKYHETGRKYSWFVLACASFALIAVTRPTNIIILPFLMLWNFNSGESLSNRARHFLKPANIMTFLSILFIVVLPQLIYWRYLTGKFFYYPYGNQGFSNWSHPRLPEVWFSTLNGLFAFNPVYFFILAGVILMILKKQINGILLLVLFLCVSYVSASWEYWYFGCSYGQRTFTEYLSFFSLPFGFLVGKTMKLKKVGVKAVILFFAGIFSLYNILILARFEKCFFGSTWDWNEYGRLVLGGKGIFRQFDNIRHFSNDMENDGLTGQYYVNDSIYRTGNHSILINPDPVRYRVHSLVLRDYGPVNPGKVDLSFWMWKIKDSPHRIMLACSIGKQDSIPAWESKETRFVGVNAGKWFPVRKTFIIPANFPGDMVLNVYVRNHDTINFYMDDLEISYRKK